MKQKVNVFTERQIFTITLFGPIELYYTNSEEFWFILKDIFTISRLLFAVCMSVCLIAGIFLRGKVRDL